MKRALTLLPVTILLLGACTQTGPTPPPTPTETETVTVSVTPDIPWVPERPTPEPTTPGEIITQARDFARSRASELNSQEIHSVTSLEYALVSEGISREDARWAADSLDVDWNQNAVRAVRELDRVTTNSRAGMLRDLKARGFTQEEAHYGIDNSWINYHDNALQTAYQLHQSTEEGMLYEEIRHGLVEWYGFLPEEADWAIDNMYPHAVG